MTQEELDALMGGDIDLDSLEDEAASEETAEEASEPEALPEDISDEEAAQKWGPPATDENKVVHQLDDVTKESEEKATEIFDIIESVSTNMMDGEENINAVMETLQSNIDLFEKLTQKFPDVETFATQLEANKEALEKSEELLGQLQDSGDSLMQAMDIMQYQDIHRQKIERVINVMRALSKYMNSLFDSKVEDEKRVSSAQHIVGDTHNDVASTEDIEALLEQFGNK